MEPFKCRCKNENLQKTSHEIIENKMIDITRTMLIIGVFSFILNIVGCCIVVLKPFGHKQSIFVAGIEFAVSILVNLAFLIIYLKHAGKFSWRLMKCSLKYKGFYEGFSKFVKENYLEINKLYLVTDEEKATFKIYPSTDDLNNLERIFVEHYIKRTFIFGGIIVAYAFVLSYYRFVIAHFV